MASSEKQSTQPIHFTRKPDTIHPAALPANQPKLPWTSPQMEILLNGEPRTIDPSWTIADLLTDLKIENRYCAVERNSQVVPREVHTHCKLQAGDVIEVVTLVGGG